VNLKILFSLAFLIIMPASAVAQDIYAVDKGDTAWLLISTALVMLMTPGLAFFYGGMSRQKNVLGTIMHSFMLLCVISVIWVLWGCTLAFGPDKWGIIGNFEWFGLSGVGSEPAPMAPTVPHLAFMMFQGMFAVITPALISGALATGIFASTSVNQAGADGLFFGNPSLLWTQALAVLSTYCYVFVVSYIILKSIDLTLGLRVSEEEEETGLDYTQHGESGYTF
jgi:ammonia channel protein AmtB